MKLQHKQHGKRDGYYLLQAAIWLVIALLAWVAVTKCNIVIDY